MAGIEESVNQLIDYIYPSGPGTDGKYVTRDGRVDRVELKEELRKILGIDKQCFACSEWKFDYDLSLVESVGKYVCQDCAEAILSGEKRISGNLKDNL